MFLLCPFVLTHPRTFQYRDARNREEHIQRKIDLMVTEAKTKMAKKDKKGELVNGNACVYIYIYSFGWME